MQREKEDSLGDRNLGIRNTRMRGKDGPGSRVIRTGREGGAGAEKGTQRAYLEPGMVEGLANRDALSDVALH